jgi:hypothetical protein
MYPLVPLAATVMVAAPTVPELMYPLVPLPDRILEGAPTVPELVMFPPAPLPDVAQDAAATLPEPVMPDDALRVTTRPSMVLVGVTDPL